MHGCINIVLTNDKVIRKQLASMGAQVDTQAHIFYWHWHIWQFQIFTVYINIYKYMYICAKKSGAFAAVDDECRKTFSDN